MVSWGGEGRGVGRIGGEGEGGRKDSWIWRDCGAWNGFQDKEETRVGEAEGERGRRLIIRY